MKFIFPIHNEHCTKLHTTKFITCCTVKFIEKLIFLLYFGFVKAAKNKVFILN